MLAGWSPRYHGITLVGVPGQPRTGAGGEPNQWGSHIRLSPGRLLPVGAQCCAALLGRQLSELTCRVRLDFMRATVLACTRFFVAARSRRITTSWSAF